MQLHACSLLHARVSKINNISTAIHMIRQRSGLYSSPKISRPLSVSLASCFSSVSFRKYCLMYLYTFWSTLPRSQVSVRSCLEPYSTTPS